MVEERARTLPGATGAPAVVAEDGTAATVFVPVSGKDVVEVAEVVTDLRAAAAADLPDGLTASVTGPAAIQADLAAVFDGADTRLLAATASIVALLLVITYRSPFLWLVPLTVVEVADQRAAVVATHTLAAFGVLWDESTIGILSVLVFGAGTDYALLLISRYRDELRVTPDRREAMATALRRTAQAVVSSAATVVLGLLTLLLSLFPATRGLGLACAIGVVVAATFTLVVLPAALVVFGRWIFWPKVPHVGQTGLADGQSFGAGSGRRRATPRHLRHRHRRRAGRPRERHQPDPDRPRPVRPVPPEAGVHRRGGAAGRVLPAGAADPARVMTRATPGPSRPRSATSRASRGPPGCQRQRRLRGRRGHRRRPGSDAAADTVVAIRDAVSDLPDTHVGETEAEGLDASEASARDRQVILPLILVLVLVALAALLRSVVAPVVLVATVVATYLASLGLSWVIFTQPLGFDRLDDGVPLLAFVFLVALGVDYNIFS